MFRLLRDGDIPWLVFFVIGSLLTLNSRSGRSMAEESDSLDFFLEKKDDDDGGDEWIRCGPWELMFRFQSADCSRAERFHSRTQSITECGFTRAESATEATPTPRGTKRSCWNTKTSCRMQIGSLAAGLLCLLDLWPFLAWRKGQRRRWRAGWPFLELVVPSVTLITLISSFKGPSGCLSLSFFLLG